MKFFYDKHHVNRQAKRQTERQSKPVVDGKAVARPVWLFLPCMLLLSLLSACSQPDVGPPLDKQLGAASVVAQGDRIRVSTGQITREWKLTRYGLLTASVAGVGGSFPTSAKVPWQDWNLLRILPDRATAELVSLTAEVSTDQGFTSEHLELVAEFEYRKAGLGLQYIVWAYPGSPGLRTQIRLRTLAGYKRPKALDDVQPRAEYLPLDTAQAQTTAAGYFNDTQNRNNAELELLKERTSQGNSSYLWANLVQLQFAQNGLILVQESHKSVNQPGVATGEFHVWPEGVAVSGLGLTPQDLNSQYQPLWAHWLIAYEGGAGAGQLALKQFDRQRYPLDPERDIYTMANTWGSGNSREASTYAAREENVLAEIASQAELGIDVQQVDAGWQGREFNHWDYVSSQRSEKFGEYAVYPQGWKNIRQRAAEAGVKLGLWARANAPLDKLKATQQEGGFLYYKFDFAVLNTYAKLRAMLDKVRAFVLHTEHRVRVNWDITENAPRVGYFLGREYGNVYLSNRKTARPQAVVYQPYLVLRDAWQLARYTNLNKFQISIQNTRRVDRQLSDAYLYSDAYAVAIALMGSPVFFQETRHYDAQARAEIKPLLAAYKQHRDEIHSGYVFGVGEKPNNRNWTGFQSYNPESSVGYLTLFRELHNEQAQKTIQLRFLRDTTVQLTDLLTGNSWQAPVGGDGAVNFAIDRPADFRFLQYREISPPL